jgi:UDP-N-acetyl-D-glucosamine dehydrogenase
MSATGRVVIIGQGYVGLPLAVAAAEAGFDVTGVDVSASHVEQLNRGSSPFEDVTDERLQAVLAAGHFRALSDYAPCRDADVIVICVPTPYHDDSPDLSYIESAGRQVGRYLRDDTTVILESTTYPGTTDDVLRPLLEEASGLKAGRDFHLVFSPERIDPGNPRFGLRNTPKIVGGSTPEATERARAFYGAFVDTIVEVSEPTTAETAKLLENTFRHINIALVNEFAIICADLGIDVWEVIEAASTKPFGFMRFSPGPGVGGHCIPVDPMYLSWRVRQFGGAAKFIELARDVNDAMPLYCASRVQELLNDEAKPVRGSRVLILGVAYKRDIADLRETPALPLIGRLAQKGALIDYHDPYITTIDAPVAGELKSVELSDEVLSAADCVVVVTDHEAIDYARVAELAPLVFDTRNVVPPGPTVVRL